MDAFRAVLPRFGHMFESVPMTATLPTDVQQVFQRFVTTEFTTVDSRGRPITWPLTPYYSPGDPCIDVTTGLGYPKKAKDARANPKVAMLFSDPTGSGVSEPGAVLIQGDATAEDRIVTDMLSDADLAALWETLVIRQPAGTLWSSWLGKRMWWSYYMRILIYVTPGRGSGPRGTSPVRPTNSM